MSKDIWQKLCHNVVNIELQNMVERFSELDVSGIAYRFWQCGEDFSVHLFVQDILNVAEFSVFYLSIWKKLLMCFSHVGYSEDEIEAVFRGDMEGEECAIFYRMDADKFLHEIGGCVSDEVRLVISDSFELRSIEFGVFKEEGMDSSQYAEYLIYDSNKIGILMYL